MDSGLLLGDKYKTLLIKMSMVRGHAIWNDNIRGGLGGC